ncbi:MAG: NADPH-dependent glutamate synthase [Terriglobales bacterium]
MTIEETKTKTTTKTATKSKNPVPNRERIKMPRQHMPEQLPVLRAQQFTEVNLGYSEELARQEAIRCLECAKPTCTHDCPVGVNVKEFVQLIVEGDFLGAAAKIRENNVLPAITGRVCPQEDHCEGACLLKKKGESLGIGYLERFVADYEQQHFDLKNLVKAPPTGKKVAIVGSGPSGLTAAGDLVQKGHSVHVFEALHEVGGVLVYGIPEFRLPKKIIRQQVDYMRAMGVEFETDVVVGRTVTIDELLEEEGYDAVFIGTGAGLPQFMGIPGEHLNGVYSANEFLTRINLMHAYEFPKYDEPMVDFHGKDVAVIGGGNTALDAIRSALRLGARKAYVLYRRSEAEMPARAEEVKHAKEEGIEFHVLTAPVEFLSDGKGWLTGARCLKMQLGEPDASGRRRPVPIDGSEYDVPLSVAVMAIGTTANPIVQSTTPGLNTNKRGYIEADATQRTSRKGVFAGGDIVTGAATVILAMGAGRRAAKGIDDYLTTGQWS